MNKLGARNSGSCDIKAQVGRDIRGSAIVDCVFGFG